MKEFKLTIKSDLELKYFSFQIYMLLLEEKLRFDEEIFKSVMIGLLQYKTTKISTIINEAKKFNISKSLSEKILLKVLNRTDKTIILNNNQRIFLDVNELMKKGTENEIGNFIVFSLSYRSEDWKTRSVVLLSHILKHMIRKRESENFEITISKIYDALKIENIILLSKHKEYSDPQFFIDYLRDVQCNDGKITSNVLNEHNYRAEVFEQLKNLE